MTIGEGPDRATLRANDDPSWITMSVNRGDGLLPVRHERLDAQLVDEAGQHPAHERVSSPCPVGEAGAE